MARGRDNQSPANGVMYGDLVGERFIDGLAMSTGQTAARGDGGVWGGGRNQIIATGIFNTQQIHADQIQIELELGEVMDCG